MASPLARGSRGPAAFASVLLVAGILSSCAAGPEPPDASDRPNLVFVLADDLDRETMDHLPRLRAMLDGAGTSFSNAFVSDSLCCPSRSTILRGQYPHSTGIFTNLPPDGGFSRFHDLGREDSTIATWLHDAGYRTALLGKYLNGYPDAAVGRAYVPKGWDVWASPVAGNPYGEYDYTLNQSGALVRYGRAEDDYLVDVLADGAERVIRDDVLPDGRRKQPLFLYVAPFKPHEPANPAPRYAGAFADQTAPRVPSFDEPDVSDKPAYVRQPRLTPVAVTAIDALYRRRLASMLAVEDLVARIIAALAATGELERTYLFFSSDNGFHLGQHRLLPGKQTAYDEDIRVPLVVRGPGVPAGRMLDHLVQNADLAPTFAALAGIAPPYPTDGRSLAPLLDRSPPPASAWRQALLVEHVGAAGALTGPAAGPLASAAARLGLATRRPTAPSGAPLEPPDPLDQSGASRAIPTYQAIRTATHLYVEYATGERELYDVTRDPYELASLHASEPALAARLAAALARLRTCAGDACRAAEDLAAP